MRRSLSSIVVLTTSVVVAVATVSGPAVATAPPADVTRELVLTVASGIAKPDIRTHDVTETAVRQIIAQACHADLDGTAELYQWRGSALVDTGVTGVVLRAAITEPDGSGSSTSRMCAFGVLTASASAQHRLTGSYTWGLEIGRGEYHEFNKLMSRNVEMTPVHSAPRATDVYLARLTAAGASESSVHTMIETRLETPKTKKQLKAAKSKRKAAVKAAKATYRKAVRSAGRSKAKRAAALKRYRTSTSRANKVYQRETRTFVIKRRGHTERDSQAFTLDLSNYEEIY